MNTLHFKTNVQLKNIIGKDLINNDNIAILELIKNSFDADAKRVDISFVNLKENDDAENQYYSDRTSRIIIRDNGVGMDLTDIRDKWLNIAYSEKKNRARQYNRMMAGAKGVGRFSCDRLGMYLNLYAKKKDSTCVLLTIDWKRFEIDDESKEIQSIDLEYSELSNEELLEKGLANFEHGVILEIIKLRSNWVYNHGNYWDTDKLFELRRYLEKLINPNQAFEKNDFGIFLNASEFEAENASRPDNEKFIGKIENTIFKKLDFKTTSIECEIVDDGKCLLTTLKDKGETIYWIKEWFEHYPYIKNLKITLYYLNTYAKVFFTKQTGVRSVQYGSVFLFLNGFRIPPYGEEGDDWLKLEQRRTQGYARFISARDLVGQIEILDECNDFQIVSSREGLVKNDNYDRLTSRKDGIFYKVLRRLERYVVDGLNWDSIPESEKRRIAEIEKKIIAGEVKEQQLLFQEDPKTKRSRIYGSIHSIIGASPQKTIELYINEHLISEKIEEEKLIAEKEFAQLLEDFKAKKISGDLLAQIIKKKAEESEELERQLKEFSRYSVNDATTMALAEMSSYKDTVKQQAQTIALLHKQITEYEQNFSQQELAIQNLKEAQKKADAKITQLEEERDLTQIQNRYLESTRMLTNEDEALIHLINVYSVDIKSAFHRISDLVSSQNVSSELLEEINVLKLFFEKIQKVGSLLLKADIVKLSESNIINIPEYINQYLESCRNIHRNIKFTINNKQNVRIARACSLLDISLIIDNLISNSKKVNATTIQIDIIKDSGKLIIDFSDSGEGVPRALVNNPEKMFEVGVTTRYLGSGVGLASVKNILNSIKANIYFLGNGVYLKGATFRIEFES